MANEKARRAARRRKIYDAFISILIGACVAFMTALFDGLADYLRANSQNIVAGMSATAYYLAKVYRA